MPRPTRNSQAAADNSFLDAQRVDEAPNTSVASTNSSSSTRADSSGSTLAGSLSRPSATAVPPLGPTDAGEPSVSSVVAPLTASNQLCSNIANSPNLVQSIVNAVQATVQSSLPALVEAAVAQHHQPVVSSGHSGLGEAAIRFERSGEPGLYLPSASSCPPAAVAARSASQSASGSGMSSISFLPAPEFLRTFNPVLENASALEGQTPSLNLAGSVVSPNRHPLQPTFEQPFVVGPGYSPIPYKIVSRIVAGHFVNLADLLPDNNSQADENEPQLFLDGRLALTASRRVNKRQIGDLFSWIEAFSIYMLILTTYYPKRWKDLTAYKLLILRTYRQFGGKAWLNYDKAFREHAAAAKITDWSSLNVQLYNFHSAGSHVRSPLLSDEPKGLSSSPVLCKSWNAGRCVAPQSQCRFKHVCERCLGDHRARECTANERQLRTTSSENAKRRKH